MLNDTQANILWKVPNTTFKWITIFGVNIFVFTNEKITSIWKILLALPYSKNASWTSHSWISKYSRCSFYHGFQLLYVLSCLWFISFGWACDNYSNTYVLVLYAHKVILMEPFNYTCAQSFLYKMMNICKYLDWIYCVRDWWWL